MTSALPGRRRWLALLATAASLVLVACGSPIGGAAPDAAGSASATPSTPSTGSALLPAAEGKVSYPLTLKSPWGETVLKQRPERIAIATGANDLDNTLALGVTPVWADDWQAAYEWAQAAGAKKIEKLGEVTDTIPAEAIAAAEPDLIIAIQTDAGILEDAYDKLAAFATVLTVDKPSWDVTWQDAVRQIGTTLDLGDRAQQVISGVDGKIAAAAEANPAFQGKSLSFVLWLQGNEKLTYRSFAGLSTAELFTRLGFTAPASATNFSRDNMFLSAENYALIDADLVVVAAPKTQFNKLQKTATFAAVPAIAQGRYVLLDLSVEKELGWAVSWPSALSVPWFLDKIVPPLADKLG